MADAPAATKKTNFFVAVLVIAVSFGIVFALGWWFLNQSTVAGWFNNMKAVTVASRNTEKEKGSAPATTSPSDNNANETEGETERLRAQLAEKDEKLKEAQEEVERQRLARHSLEKQTKSGRRTTGEEPEEGGPAYTDRRTRERPDDLQESEERHQTQKGACRYGARVGVYIGGVSEERAAQLARIRIELRHHIADLFCELPRRNVRPLPEELREYWPYTDGRIPDVSGVLNTPEGQFRWRRISRD